MTLPPVIRIFFAIDLAPATKHRLGHFIGLLKKKSKSHAIRWSRSENLHITLQFLTEVRLEHLARLIHNVRASLNHYPHKVHLELGELHLFPNPYRPRVIVLDISPQRELASLAEAIGKGILNSEYPIEERPFRAHLTLGRLKHTHGIKLDFLSGITPETEKFNVSEVVLFRSEPQPEGSTYTPLEKISI